MQRGDVVIAAGGLNAEKPRPCIVMQADEFSGIDSVTVCPITSTEANAPDLRIPVSLPGDSGLAKPSWAMIDKITTLRRTGIRQVIGRLTDDELARIARAVIVFLRLA